MLEMCQRFVPNVPHIANPAGPLFKHTWDKENTLSLLRIVLINETRHVPEFSTKAVQCLWQHRLRFPTLRDYGALEPVRIDRHRNGPEVLATPTPVAAPCRSGCPRRQPAGPRSVSRVRASAAPGGRRPLWSARGATARTASSRLRGNRVRVRVRVRVRGPDPNPDTN